MSSQTQPTDETVHRSDSEVVEEHYELLDRMAGTDLPIADRCERVLEKYERGDLDEC